MARFSPDGSLLVSVSDDCTVKVFELQEDTHYSLTDHGKQVNCSFQRSINLRYYAVTFPMMVVFLLLVLPIVQYGFGALTLSHV